MPKSPKQKQKLIILERIFREETDDDHGLSLSELAQRLEQYGIGSERKSLYDDIQTLCDLGLDIESDKRARNTTYYLASREFEAPELHLLANAVASSKFISSRKSAQLIDKIAGLAGKYEGSKLVRQMIVSDRLKSSNESIYYVISAANEAIQTKKKLSFMYYDYDKRKKKVYHDSKPLVITPRALVWKDENYYVVGYYDKYESYVNFRADKMEKAEILDIPAEKDDKFNVTEHCRRLFGMFGGHTEKVRLRFDDSLAGVVIDRFGQKLPFVSAENGFYIETELAVSPVFFGWLFQFGDKAEILAPEEVRDEFAKFGRKTLKQYTKKRK